MCGPSGQQKQVEAEQNNLFQTLAGEASQVFGPESALYSDLLAKFQPIFDAGPNQEGFSAQEKSALENQAITGTAGNFQKAETAVRERAGGAGGGNEYIPAGQTAELESEVGSAAAGETSSEEQQIEQADYSTGRQNWLAASEGLLGAGSVFAPSESMSSTAVGAGSATANAANQIAQEQNSWMGAFGGMLGQAAGGYLTGASWT